MHKNGRFAYFLVLALVWSLRTFCEESITVQADKLILQMKSREAYSRKSECDKLVALGAAAVPALSNAIKVENATMLRSLYEVLERIGPASVPALVAGFRREKQEMWNVPRSSAALAHMGTPAIPAILELMKDADPWARRIAIIALKEMGSKAVDAYPALVEAVKDGNAEVSGYAIEAIAAVQRDPAQAVPVLLDVLRGPSPREQATIALGTYGPAAQAALPILLPNIASHKIPCYWAVIPALLAIDPECEQTLSAFTEVLSSAENEIRFFAANALLEQRKAVEQALPVLSEELKHPKKSIREHAAYIAVQLDASNIRELLPALAFTLEQDKDPRAIQTISKVWPDMNEAAAVIQTALGSSDTELVLEMARAISKAAPAAESTGAALKKALEDHAGRRQEDPEFYKELERIYEDVDRAEIPCEIVKKEISRSEDGCIKSACILRLKESGEEFSLAPVSKADPSDPTMNSCYDAGLNEETLRLRWLWRDRLIDVSWDTLGQGNGQNIMEAHMLLLKTDVGWKRILRHTELGFASGGGGNSSEIHFVYAYEPSASILQIVRKARCLSSSKEKMPLCDPEQCSKYHREIVTHETYQYKLSGEMLEFVGSNKRLELLGRTFPIGEVSEYLNVPVDRLRALNPSLQNGETCTGSLLYEDAGGPFVFNENEYMTSPD